VVVVVVVVVVEEVAEEAEVEEGVSEEEEGGRSAPPPRKPSRRPSIPPLPSRRRSRSVVVKEKGAEEGEGTPATHADAPPVAKRGRGRVPREGAPAPAAEPVRPLPPPRGVGGSGPRRRSVPAPALIQPPPGGERRATRRSVG